MAVFLRGMEASDGITTSSSSLLAVIVDSNLSATVVAVSVCLEIAFAQRRRIS